MRSRFFGVVIVLSLLLLAFARAQEFAPASATLPSTQPSTQPAAQTTANPPASTEEQAKFYDQLLRTQVAEIMEGKKTLTWETIKDPRFWAETVRDLLVTLITFVPRFIGTMVFLLVFYLLYRGIRRVAMRNMQADDVDTSISHLLGSLIKWVVMGFGVVIACNQLGIPIVAMLTGVSLIGLAVGFAAQETLANFIAGIVIFLDKPFRIGEWIEMNGTFGQVKRVTFRATRILTLDGEVVILPNTQILSSKLANHSMNKINRVSVPIGIAYKESIDAARKVLLDLTRQDDRLERSPAPEVIVHELGESSVNLHLRFWIADESIERRVMYEYLERAKNALDAANIQIPFPHVQLIVEQTPAMEALASRRG